MQMQGAIAICAAGRLPQTDLMQVGETSYAFQIPQARSIGHLVVFLTGATPFPPGAAATIHLQLPPSPTSSSTPSSATTSTSDFRPLGILTNDKPSAIFRIRSTSSSSVTATAGAGDTSISDVGTLGIQLVPIAEAEAFMVALQQQQQSSTGSAGGGADGGGALVPIRQGSGAGAGVGGGPEKIAERVVKNLFNYIHSWDGAAGAPLTPQTPIPLGVFQRWYENAMTKLRNGQIGWIERDEE